MTSNKAQKRAIRARMAKTGEHYTTARHYHLDQHLSSAPDSAATAKLESLLPASLPPRVTEPGLSDASIQRGSGKTWDEWFVILDAWDATERTHTEIARHLVEDHDVSGWWAQSVTVGYERARGKRAIHQQATGYAVNVSKTIPLPISDLVAAFVDETRRDTWLEPGTLRLRTSQVNRSARFDVLPNATRLNATFIAKSESKSTIQLEHEKLPVAADVETWRTFWKERLARLAESLTKTL